MRDPEDLPMDHDTLTRPIRPDERLPRRGPGPLVASALLLVLLFGGALWYVRRQGGRIEPKAPSIGAPAPEAQAPPAQVATGALEPLPALDASDALVRELLLAASRHPRLASWLATDDLVRRFVAAVINVAEGSSPSTHLRFAAPTGAFQARRSGTGWIVDPESFRRYDLAASVVASLEPGATAELFRRLHPLFDLAYAELGDPNSSFDAALGRATGRLLSVPVPDPPVALVPQGTGWAFADHALEERSTAEKHLLRMGPENARRVQAHLGVLAAAIGVEPR